MSMPTFVDEIPDVSRDAAINQLIASIALEELALSHIFNAEGEKIQFAVGTLIIPDRGLSGGVTIANLVELDNSVARTLEAAASTETALYQKLRTVLGTDAGEDAEMVLVPPVYDPPATEDPS